MRALPAITIMRATQVGTSRRESVQPLAIRWSSTMTMPPSRATAPRQDPTLIRCGTAQIVVQALVVLILLVVAIVAYRNSFFVAYLVAIPASGIQLLILGLMLGRVELSAEGVRVVRPFGDRFVAVPDLHLLMDHQNWLRRRAVVVDGQQRSVPLPIASVRWLTGAGAYARDLAIVRRWWSATVSEEKIVNTGGRPPRAVYA